MFLLRVWRFDCHVARLLLLRYGIEGRFVRLTVTPPTRAWCAGLVERC